MNRALPGLLLLLLCAASARAAITLQADGYHVFPGDKIQDALEMAATNKTLKVVKVHAGEYRPDSKRQALVWFNKRHDGIRLEALGGVTLTAANPQLAKPSDPGFPAVVNHVVYFGDGISTNTILDGFRITGANSFLTRERTRQMEPDTTVPKNWFFFSDGGAIKIFGRSYPQIKNVEVAENFTSPCGAGISVQHQGYMESSVLIENCLFLTNRTQVTGCAIDLLAGSAARIINCLFVGNVSNTGEDVVAKQSGEKPFVNSGVITIFQTSQAEIRNCTFTQNRNGVDDMGGASSYINNIFYDNKIEGAGNRGLGRYELAMETGAKEILGNFINGAILDGQKVISREKNTLDAPDPKFDKDFAPQAPEYKNVGYRPVKKINDLQ
jgi:hypothetical protein